MAAPKRRRAPRKKAAPRKTNARRPARRRPAAKAPARRRRPRKKNPSYDIMGTLVAMVGGASAGAGAYALDGVALSPAIKMAILGLGGGALGVVVGGFSKAAGCGIAAAGAALVTKTALDTYMAGQPLGALPGYAYASLPAGSTTARFAPQQIGAIESQLSAVQTDLGAVQTDLGAVESMLYGV